jgi:hypothetical protein
LNDKEDDKDGEKKEQHEEEDVTTKGMFVEQCYNCEDIWHGMRVHCEFPEGNKQEVGYSEHTMHGRVKELMAGPLKRGPEDGGQW